MQKVLKSLALGALVALGPMSAVQAADQQVELLVYRVWEEGVNPYVSRVLVTPRYVRMDEGEGGRMYTLYDRKEGVLYNVDEDERSILVIKPPVSEPAVPGDLELTRKVGSDEGAPTIAGRVPQRVTLLANGEVCRELVTVPGLMASAVAGMRDMQRTLGHVQAATLSIIPAEMQTACDLAENVYAPLRRLDHGLPIQEDEHGRGRALVDFSSGHAVSETLFVLPDDYRRSEMAALGASPE
jgi:hypothetical protein